MTSKHVIATLRVCFIEERSCITSELTGAAIMNNLESKEQVNEMRNLRSTDLLCPRNGGVISLRSDPWPVRSVGRTRAQHRTRSISDGITHLPSLSIMIPIATAHGSVPNI